MALDTLGDDTPLSKFTQLSVPAVLGNVYGPGGGFASSPLGGGVNGTLTDATSNAVLDTLRDKQTAIRATAPSDVSQGDPVSLAIDLGGSTTSQGGGGGDGGDGGAGGGPGGDGAGAGSGD